MAKRRFAVETPEQLRELDALRMSGNLAALATVWSADRRQNGGRSKWDGSIFVDLEGSRTAASRTCAVTRVAHDGQVRNVAALRYNEALRWCSEHLRQFR